MATRRKFLGDTSAGAAVATPELLETLERWGIRRFQELAALPPLGIAERLGAEGLRLRELARGEADRKLLPIEEALAFEDEIELEYPVELLEPLAFLLARLINGLATRLATRGLATDELRLRLKLETARDARADAAAAGAVAGHQGVSEAAATGSGAASAAPRRSCMCGWG